MVGPSNNAECILTFSTQPFYFRLHIVNVCACRIIGWPACRTKKNENAQNNFTMSAALVSIKVINKIGGLFMMEGWALKCQDHKSHMRQMHLLCVTWYSFIQLFIILFMIVVPSRIAWAVLPDTPLPFMPIYPLKALTIHLIIHHFYILFIIYSSVITFSSTISNNLVLC